MKNRIVNGIKTYTNKIVNSELYIIIIGLILFFKMFFFYMQTIYKVDSIQIDILVKTFIFSMFIVTALFVCPNRARFHIGTVVNLLFSILMFADNLYYNYSTSLLSVSQISNLQYGEQISATVKDLMNIWQILYFLDLVILIVLRICNFIKLEKKKRTSFKPAILYVVIMAVIFGSTIPNYISEAEACRYNKKQQLELGTLYTFHYLDIKANINMRENVKYKNKADMEDAYAKLKSEYANLYEKDIYGVEGIAQGKNVILLQLEAYQGFIVNKTINGKEITPNLNRFLEENIKVDNMMIQSYSTTADSEHSAMSSLYPLENGMAFAQYSSNSYDDIFKLYNDAGYYTVYMHGNEGSFWNRKNVYGPLKIDEIDFIEDFAPDSEIINNWVSDEDLYRQAVQKLKVAEESNGSFFANIVSASCHTGFDLPGMANKYDKVNIDVGKYKYTYFGNFLEAANYADYAFGIFIDELKKNDLYDNTVIFLFGDHYAMQMYNEEMMEFLEQTDHKYNNVENEINYINVVCGMRIPGADKMKIEKTVSKLDIKPTLTYLSGIEDGFSLGTNMFGNKDFACTNNGIVITDEYYYNGDWFYRLNGEKINQNNLDEETKAKLDFYVKSMEEELNISNSVVLNNLLKK